METRNIEWTIEAGPMEKFLTSKITHALLMDIREAARSMRRMMVFFTVLVVIELLAAFVWLLTNVVH